VLVVLSICAVLVILAVIQWLLSGRDRRHSAPSGTFVNGLHVRQSGAGEPAIIFESGLAASSLSWSSIQVQLPAFTTYSYDRAGFGLSPTTDNRCSLDHIVEQLHALVHALPVRPGILVAHSFGGYIARLYTSRYPDNFAALVLVDPLTPEEWTSPGSAQRWRLRRAVFFTRAAGVLACFGIVRFGLWLILRRKQDTPGPVSRFSQTMQRIHQEVRKFPPDVIPLIRANWSSPRFFWAMAENLRALPTCAAAVAQCSIPRHIPVTVLSAANQPQDVLAAHAALANVRHIIAHLSGHFIHMDEPALVLQAVRQMIEVTSHKTA
jgi:pimeloyl-ACP methyl ester carboxylesterase